MDAKSISVEIERNGFLDIDVLSTALAQKDALEVGKILSELAYMENGKYLYGVAQLLKVLGEFYQYDIENIQAVYPNLGEAQL